MGGNLSFQFRAERLKKVGVNVPVSITASIEGGVGVGGDDGGGGCGGW